MLIWFRRLLSYQGHAIWAAAPSPDAPAAQSEIEPQVHSALGVRFLHLPYWHNADITIAFGDVYFRANSGHR